MRITLLQARLATIIDSATSRKHGVRQQVQALNDWQRSLVRLMASKAEGYVNYHFDLDVANARVVHANEYTYRLPPWVISVEGVRESSDSTAARQPYLRRAAKWGRVPGWEQTASNELRVFRWGQPRGLTVECSKLPSLMVTGILPDQSGAGTNQLQLDADPDPLTSDFPHETVQNAYAGGLFEIVAPPSERVGQLLRCTGSLHDQSGAGTLLTMEEDWATQPLTGDTYESHTEIPDQHLNLLLMCAARRLFAQSNNVDAFTAFRDEYLTEMASFERFITTREHSEPVYIGEGPGDDYYPDSVSEYLI